MFSPDFQESVKMVKAQFVAKKYKLSHVKLLGFKSTKKLKHFRYKFVIIAQQLLLIIINIDKLAFCTHPFLFYYFKSFYLATKCKIVHTKL